MIANSLSIKDEIDGFVEAGNIVWDFEDAPHLFPLFLFLHFKKKYCQTAAIECLKIKEFFELDYAFCRCPLTELSPEYSVWIQIVKIWETATRFTFLIGDNDFIPFKNREKEHGVISLRVATYAYADTDVHSHCYIHGCDFRVLKKYKELSDEIEAEMKKENIKFKAKVR